MRLPMLRSAVLPTTLAMLFALSQWGCAGSSQVGASSPQPGGGGNLGAEKAGDGGGNLGGGEGGGNGQDSLLDPNATIFNAKYDIKVKSLFGISVCEGEADIEVGLKFDLKPKGQVQCLFNSITIDLEKMLAGLDNGTQKSPGVEVEDHVLYFTNLAGTDFSPPRPLMVSPFSATKKEMRRIRTSDSHSVTTSDGKSGSGNITLDVVGVDQSFAPDNMNYVFKNILHWRISTTGFDGVKSKGLLFEEMEFFWNIDPIAIPRLKLKGHIKDFLGEGGLGDLGGGGGASGGGTNPLGGILGGLGGGGGGGAGGGLFDIFKDLAVDIAGDFDIDIQLKEMEGLDLDDDD